MASKHSHNVNHIHVEHSQDHFAKRTASASFEIVNKSACVSLLDCQWGHSNTCVQLVSISMTMQAFMWQDDLHGVARFIHACFASFTDSAGGFGSSKEP